MKLYESWIISETATVVYHFKSKWKKSCAPLKPVLKYRLIQYANCKHRTTMIFTDITRN